VLGCGYWGTAELGYCGTEGTAELGYWSTEVLGC